MFFDDSPGFSCASTHSGLDVAWIHVVGSLDIASTPELERMLGQPHLRALLVVLDLRELTFLDSSGLHAIVGASNQARTDGRRIFLLRGQPAVDRVFTLSGLSGQVDIGDVDGVDRSAKVAQMAPLQVV